MQFQFRSLVYGAQSMGSQSAFESCYIVMSFIVSCLVYNLILEHNFWWKVINFCFFREGSRICVLIMLRGSLILLTSVWLHWKLLRIVVTFTMGGVCSRKRGNQVNEDGVRLAINRRYSKNGSSKWLLGTPFLRTNSGCQLEGVNCPSLIELCVHKTRQVKAVWFFLLCSTICVLALKM